MGMMIFLDIDRASLDDMVRRVEYRRATRRGRNAVRWKAKGAR
jgi:hypothetical protein